MSKQENGKLLEVIDPNQLQKSQVMQGKGNKKVPAHRLVREPADREEFQSYEPGVAILHNNGTKAYIALNGKNPFKANDKSLRLKFGYPMTITIVGEEKDKVAETAAYYWSLNDPELTADTSPLQIICSGKDCSFTDFSCEQLAQLFDSNPRRKVTFMDAEITAEQSVVLATRPRVVDLQLMQGCSFQDGGAAFVVALEKRTSTFGKLHIGGRDSCSDPVCLRSLNQNGNLKRLLTISNLRELKVSACPFTDLIPFIYSSPIHKIDWGIETKMTQSIGIEGKRARLIMLWRGSVFPAESIFSHLSSLNALKLTGLTLQASTPRGCDPVHLPNKVIQDLLRFLDANPQLDSLDITECDIGSGDHWKMLFQAVEDHKGLQSYRIDKYPVNFDPDRTWLAQLLSKKKNFDLRDLNGRGIELSRKRAR